MCYVNYDLFFIVGFMMVTPYCLIDDFFLYGTRFYKGAV